MIKHPVSRRRLLSRSGLAMAGFQLAAHGTPAFGKDVEGIEVRLDPAEGFAYFDEKQAALLTDVADIMIPETDTPGAVASATIPYIDTMMTDWADEDTRSKFAYFGEALDKMAAEKGHPDYLAMPRVQREGMIEGLDKDSFRQRREPLSIAYRKVKGLVFHIHYTSAEANPDYVLVPGEYRGNLTWDEYRKLTDERKLQQ